MLRLYGKYLGVIIGLDPIIQRNTYGFPLEFILVETGTGMPQNTKFLWQDNKQDWSFEVVPSPNPFR